MRRPILFLFFAISFPALLALGAEPPVDVEYIDGQHVYIKNPQWHEKEGGKWLFTCRLEAAAERLVKPVAHLRFYKAEESEDGEKIIWQETGTVWRRKFDRSYGSRKASFVRVFIDSFPDDLDAIKVEFRNEPPGSS